MTDEDRSASICVDCGLCCDGTLHASATVRPDDVETVKAAGLSIVDDGSRRFFRQPCPRFSCGGCTIYASRPGVCRTYRCALLIKVESGEMTAAEARELISTAMELRAAVSKEDPSSVTPAQRSASADRLRKLMMQQEAGDREASAKALLANAALEHFLNRWFLKRKEESGPLPD